MPGWRPRLAHRPVWCSGSVRLWHRLHRLWTALLFAALAAALAAATLASALPAAALDAAALAAPALAAALAAPALAAATFTATFSSADVVQQHVYRSTWQPCKRRRLPGRRRRLAFQKVWNSAPVCLRHRLHRLRSTLYVPAVVAPTLAVDTASLTAAPTHEMQRLMR